ncbi:unnamed protein product, partial [Musa hybrid cultivar]
FEIASSAAAWIGVECKFCSFIKVLSGEHANDDSSEFGSRHSYHHHRSSFEVEDVDYWTSYLQGKLVRPRFYTYAYISFFLYQDEKLVMCLGGEGTFF